MGLKLYNTMGRTMQDFEPIQKDFVGFYGCGPTVYNYAHIGNLRAYVFLDILDKTLTFLGYKIKHVMNITDIGHLTGDADEGEDKMLKTATARHQSVLEVAKFYTDAFFNDIDRLNIRRPDVVCKATEHIQEMIELIKRIEANGHTYMAGGNLYYDVTTYPDYGKLAGLNLDDLKAGARIDVDQNKRNPYDFVLWFTKSKFENQALTWESPWGRGYPGWHIECSAMSMKYLGEHFDIHTGGIDHVPIHHTNEIAQSEGATGKKWVNYWLHNEFLVIAKDKDSSKSGDKEGAKMSKSSGNFLTLQTLVDKGYDPIDYRFFLLGTQYRKQVYFSFDAMDSAKNARKALVARIAKLVQKSNNEKLWANKGFESLTEENYKDELSKMEVNQNTAITQFKAALENDLSTPQALAALQSDAAERNGNNAAEILQDVFVMDNVLGLKLLEGAFKAINSSVQAPSASVSEEDKEIDELVKARTEAKKAKDFAKADKIRNDLAAKGIIITDTPSGSVWNRS
jgi:cysteinyl-tRNA synthetase